MEVFLMLTCSCKKSNDNNDPPPNGTVWNVFNIPIKANLNSVFMINSSLGWIAGDSGIILKYNGTSWIKMSTNTDQNLMAVYFVDNLHGWAVGNSGTIIATSDGLNWAKQQSGVKKNLKDIYMNNLTTGWAVGDDSTLLKTTDGLNWVKKTNFFYPSHNCDETFNSVMFKDLNNGILTTNGGCNSSGFIFLTNDGGSTWTLQSTPGNNYDMWSGYIVNNNDIWVGTYAKGSSGLLHFNGLTWSFNDVVPDLGSANIYDFYFFNSNNGWFVTKYDGQIYNYNGTNWIQSYTIGKTLYSISFSDTSNGWAVGGNGIILKYQSPANAINYSIKPSKSISYEKK